MGSRESSSVNRLNHLKDETPSIFVPAFVATVAEKSEPENVSDFGRLRRRHLGLVVRDAHVENPPVPESDEAASGAETASQDQQVSGRSEGADGDGVASRGRVHHEAGEGRRSGDDRATLAEAGPATSVDDVQRRPLSRRLRDVRRRGRSVRDVVTRRTVRAAPDDVSRPTAALHRQHEAHLGQRRANVVIVVFAVITEAPRAADVVVVDGLRLRFRQGLSVTDNLRFATSGSGQGFEPTTTCCVIGLEAFLKTMDLNF